MSVGIPARSIAIVQQEDVAGSEPAHEAAVNAFRVALNRIEAAPRPRCQAQVQARQHGVQQWRAYSAERAEEARPLAREIGERRLCAADVRA